MLEGKILRGNGIVSIFQKLPEIGSVGTIMQIVELPSYLAQRKRESLSNSIRWELPVHLKKGEILTIVKMLSIDSKEADRLCRI